ncbi:MAG: hypothetical protein JNM82_07430 [Rhodocyclaceae bacterium]|nr:hypothetical protein [Rhodocyclaceae bacterium]
MPDNEVPPQQSPAIQAALSWLATPPAEDPLLDLVPLRSHVDALIEARLPPLHCLKILDLFQPRAIRVADTAKPLLLDAVLPLARRLRNVAQALIEVHGALAAGYLGVLRDADQTKLKGPQRNPNALATCALRNLAQQQEITTLISGPAPIDMWALTQQAFHLRHPVASVDQDLPVENSAADRVVKGMLALAAAQPESMAPREAAFLARFLRRYGPAVEISHLRPSGRHEEWFWLEESRDLPPVAMARRPAADIGNLLFFRCTALGDMTREVITQVTDGVAPAAMDLDDEVAYPDFLNVLRRARERWSSPPRRLFNRHRHNYRVHVCANTGPLWQLLHGDLDPERDANLVSTDWMVLNESAGGYAMMHVAGGISGLVPGGVIGMRAGPDNPWSICLVRWARSDNPEHIEIGLELLAPSAEPVRIAPQGRAEINPLPALLLPPIPRMDRGENLLTARGAFRPGRFSLIHESGGRIGVFQCNAQRTDIQTSSVEVFGFDRDPSPG